MTNWWSWRWFSAEAQCSFFVFVLNSFAASDDKTLRLWDTQTHVAIATLTGHTAAINSVHFSPSSSFVATASANACIRLWSTSSGTLIAALTTRTLSAVCCVAWSSDEALVAVGASDGNVGVWEVATGLPRAMLQCPQAAMVSAITLSPGTLLLAAVVAAPSACVHLFDIATSLLLASPAVGGAVDQLQWSADGRCLKDDQGDLWNMPWSWARQTISVHQPTKRYIFSSVATCTTSFSYSALESFASLFLLFVVFFWPPSMFWVKQRVSHHHAAARCSKQSQTKIMPALFSSCTMHCETCRVRAWIPIHIAARHERMCACLKWLLEGPAKFIPGQLMRTKIASPAAVSRVFAEKRKQQPIFGFGNCCCSCVWFAAYLGTVFAVQKKQEQAMHKKTPKKTSCQIRAVSNEYSVLQGKKSSRPPARPAVVLRTLPLLDQNNSALSEDWFRTGSAYCAQR